LEDNSIQRKIGEIMIIRLVRTKVRGGKERAWLENVHRFSDAELREEFAQQVEAMDEPGFAAKIRGAR
jgi:hypothetical protein